MGCSASTDSSAAAAEGGNRAPLKRRASQSAIVAVTADESVDKVDPLARIRDVIIPSAEDSIAVEAFKQSLCHSGDAFQSKYKVVQERAGWGSRSTVSRVVRLDDQQQQFAVKVVDVSLEDAAREVHLLDSLHRRTDRVDTPTAGLPHSTPAAIPCLVDVFVARSWRSNGTQLCHEWEMVMQPWCDGPSLADFVQEQHSGGLEESVAIAVTRELLEMLSFLHARKVVHRGLKPESVMMLFSDPDAPLSICVTNFHDAVSLHGAAAQHGVTRCPPEFVAPEMACGYRATTAADLWSLGVLVFFMLCGGSPFHGHTDDETLALVKSSRYAFQPESLWARVTSNAKDFVRVLLQERPTARPTAEQALQHPWLAGGCCVPQR